MVANLNIRKRMLLGYSVPILLLMGLSVLAYSISNKVSAAINNNNISQTAIRSVDKANIGLSRADRAMRGYLLTKDEKSRQSYETGIKNFREAVETAGKVIEDPSQKARFEKLIELGKRLEEFDENILSLVEDGKTSQAIKLFGTREGIKIIREIEALTDEFNDKQVAIITASTNSAQTANNFSTLR